MQKIISHGQTIMMEKAQLLLGMKDELRRTSEHFNKVSEMQTIGKREAEMKYKEQLYAIQESFEERKKNIVEQYDHILEVKDGELKKFLADANKYISDKK